MKQVTGDVSYVIFNLETGGLARTFDILQISAIHNSKEFDMYVTPTQNISRAASDVTKLTVLNGQLFHRGNAVTTLSTKDALQGFIKFLTTIQKPVLVWHNIRTFDLIFLYNNLVKCELWESFLSAVVGFIDTLPVFKTEFPKRHSYKQEVLMAELLHESYSAHNALDDVKALQRILGLVESALSQHLFGPTVIINLVNAASHRSTLKPLEENKAITKTMAGKIAKSGLQYDHLKTEFERNRFDGLASVLGESVDGTVRVTKQGKIIQNIFEYFSQL